MFMMEKLITKKRKSSDGDHDAEETVNIGSTSKKKRKKTCLYCDSYLTIDFTWCGDQAHPLPECLVCKAKLSNKSMVLSKTDTSLQNMDIFLINREYILREF